MRSSVLPCGTPSTMSTRTTSASSFSAIPCATVAPTFPPPTTVTFVFIDQPRSVVIPSVARDLGGRVVRDGPASADPPPARFPRYARDDMIISPHSVRSRSDRAARIISHAFRLHDHGQRHRIDDEKE